MRLLHISVRWRWVLALALLFLLAFALLSTYAEVKKKVIADFNAQQLLLAQQAAKGIRQNFERYHGELAALAYSRDIVEMTPDGKAQLESFLNQNSNQLRAITRMDATGHIVFTIPLMPERIGADITSQAHVAELLHTRQPVISDVFMTVQGYQAVAYHVPVLRAGRFDGSIAFVIPFEYLARDQFASIKPAARSVTWAFSQQQIELYCEQESHVGKELALGCGKDPAIAALAKQIIASQSGTTTCTAAWSGSTRPAPERWQVAYTAIELDGTHWYLVVATPESEIVATMTGFRNRLLLLAALLLVIALCVAQYVLRERLKVKEEQYQRRILEEKAALAVRYEELQRMEAIGRLAAGVAHDFNNMLTPILGYSELLLLDAPAESEMRTALNDIYQSALRARDLTHQLLAFSRKQPLAVRALDLNNVVAELTRLIRRTLRENIEIQTALCASSCIIRADQGQLQQVLLNLAINAQDAMPDGGVLSISITAEQLSSALAMHTGVLPAGMYGVLTVTDTGRGMDQVTLGNIFEPFFSTKGEQGMGLGLATVHGIVGQHGGGIAVESTPGKGTKFRVYFPAEAGTAGEPAEPPPIAGPTAVQETVLLVEDDPQVRRLVARLLNDIGYSVCQAEGASDALAQLETRMPAIHLLLTDVIMPGMNGRELYDAAHARWPQLRVLYMSGYTDDVLSKGGLLQQGTQLIYKPFSKAELMHCLRRVLETAP